MDTYQETIDFFNSRADKWDSYQKEQDYIRVDEIIARVGISKNDKVLDIACGTGILTKRLLLKGINNIVGVDISPRMIDIYKRKHPSLTAIANSFEEHYFKNEFFDSIIIFNAFPHFHNSQKIFQKCYSLLNRQGKFIIAHSMNREELNKLHENAGKEVENDILISDESFRTLYKQEGFFGIEVENGEYFFSCGTKKRSVKK